MRDAVAHVKMMVVVIEQQAAIGGIRDRHFA
jgi:hypothetical protein